MLIKKCKAPSFAHSSALWCGHLCPQWSREDQSEYLTLQPASRCEFTGMFTRSPPLSASVTPWGRWQLEGGEPTPLPPLHKASRSPRNQLGSTDALPGTWASASSERWQELVHSSAGFLFCVNVTFSLDAAQLWGSLWPRLPAKRRDPPESPLPSGASGVNVAPTSPGLWTLVYSGDQEQMSRKTGVWCMRSH